MCCLLKGQQIYYVIQNLTIAASEIIHNMKNQKPGRATTRNKTTLRKYSGSKTLNITEHEFVGKKQKHTGLNLESI